MERRLVHRSRQPGDVLPVAFRHHVQRAGDGGKFDACAKLALGCKRVGVHQPGRGEADLRTLTIAHALIVADIRIVQRSAEMQLHIAQPGKPGGAPVHAEPVGTGQIAQIVAEDPGLHHDVAAAIFGGDAEPARKAECIGKGGAFHEGDEAAAGELFHRLEIVVLAHGDVDIAGAVFDQRIGNLHLVTGEIHFHLVGEPAGNIAFDAQAGAAGFHVPAIVAAKTAWQVHAAGIQHQPAERLEAEAVLALYLGGGAHADGDGLLRGDGRGGQGGGIDGGGCRFGVHLVQSRGQRFELGGQLGNLCAQILRLAILRRGRGCEHGECQQG